MRADLIPFDYDGQQVRVFDVAGEPWFAAVDVCGILEVGNPTQALSRLDDDERTLISNEGRDINAVSEPGLYALVLGSRKPQAKPFKRWVTHEVLPAIRRTGTYAPAPVFQLPQTYSEALRALARKLGRPVVAEAVS